MARNAPTPLERRIAEKLNEAVDAMVAGRLSVLGVTRGLAEDKIIRLTVADIARIAAREIE